jgi:two-component sensor histidine kinase
MLVDVSERKQAETQQRLLLNELNHRVKNNMQMLQSLLESAARRTNERRSPWRARRRERALSHGCGCSGFSMQRLMRPASTRRIF